METLLERPANARAVLALAHGAGAGMAHPFMAALAGALAERGVATLRYEFDYMRLGSKRPDPPARLQARVRDAVAEAAQLGLPLFAGGKSMGGRMTSLAEAARPLGVRGLVFFGFPLHPAGAPAQTRGAHLASVATPMLLLQGTRDTLADLGLLRPLLAPTASAELVVIEGADHGFSVLKRSGRTNAEVLAELAERVSRFVDAILGGS